MRRTVLVFILALSFVGMAGAGEIEDLQAEAKELKTTLARYQQVIQNINVRLVQIDGVVDYLEKKEAARKAEEKKAAEVERKEAIEKAEEVRGRVGIGPESEAPNV